MDALYLIGGIVSLCLGSYITRNQIRIFRKGEQGKLGSDIKLLSGGIALVMIGIAVILKYT